MHSDKKLSIQKKKKKKVSYVPTCTLIFSGCNLNHTYFFVWPKHIYHASAAKFHVITGV